MTPRHLPTIAVAAFLLGCSSAKPVSPLLHDQRIAQDAGYSQYALQNWNAAARSFQRAADLHNAHDDFVGEAAARHNQARALQHAGKIDDAIAAYQRALDINRRLNRVAEQSQNLAGLAQCHAERGRINTAIETADRALNIATNLPAVAVVLRNDIAALLIQRHETGDLDRAQKLLDAALAGVDGKTPTTALGVTQLNLGRLALQAGKAADARPRLTKALETFRACADAVGVATAHETLARCCAALGDADAAKFHAEQARQKFDFLKPPVEPSRNKTGTAGKSKK